MPHRKDIRLKPENYIGLRTYFLTVCCDKRVPVFANSFAATRAIETLRESADLHRFAVHAYCFMPNHSHFLAEGIDPKSCLTGFVADFKHKTAHQLAAVGHGTLWQRNFYDYILRKSDSQDSIAWYIWMNPVRKGLTVDPWVYPFSGSFTLDWKNKLRPPAIWTPPWNNPTNAPE